MHPAKKKLSAGCEATVLAHKLGVHHKEDGPFWPQTRDKVGHGFPKHRGFPGGARRLFLPTPFPDGKGRVQMLFTSTDTPKKPESKTWDEFSREF